MSSGHTWTEKVFAAAAWTAKTFPAIATLTDKVVARILVVWDASSDYPFETKWDSGTTYWTS